MFENKVLRYRNELSEEVMLTLDGELSDLYGSHTVVLLRYEI
jgi:hypothetical protein